MKPQQLESVWWTEDGGYILSSHSDGSYCRWMAGREDVNEEEEKSDIPYGEDKKASTAHLSSLSGTKCVFLEADDEMSFHCCRTFPLQGHF